MEQEVRDVLDNLNVIKAYGRKLISPRLLKEGASVLFKVSKGAKIRNRYNQVPYLTQDTNGKVTN